MSKSELFIVYKLRDRVCVCKIVIRSKEIFLTQILPGWSFKERGQTLARE